MEENGCSASEALLQVVRNRATEPRPRSDGFGAYSWQRQRDNRRKRVKRSSTRQVKWGLNKMLKEMLKPLCEGADAVSLKRSGVVSYSTALSSCEM